MATFDKLTYNIPAYHAGNEADFEFDFDSSFPVNLIAQISFQCRDQKGNLVMDEKLLTTGAITLNGSTVRIIFLPANTKNKAGSYSYEIDVINEAGNPFFSMGGKFKINAEINTR